MAVWWFRATCFHGLKYLCVNREVLKQNFIMRIEMKASSECLYPTDVFLISCGMGCKRITVSDIAYIEAMKDNCISTWLMANDTLNLALWETLSQS